MADRQAELDGAIDEILDILEAGGREGVDLDPLQTILARLKARGAELDTGQMPPLMQMLLSGALG